MDNSNPKVSFSFKKIAEKPRFQKETENTKEAQKIEYLNSIDNKKFDIKGESSNANEKKEIVIPLLKDKNTRLANYIESKIKKIKVEHPKEPELPRENETLEQQSVREIIEDVNKASIEPKSKVLELPLHPDELPLDGGVQSSMDDYEKIPIVDFGKALLRGMGWKEEQKKDDLIPLDVPVPRPKGLGLGADRCIKKQPLLVQPGANETLEIKRNAFVKILAGKHVNHYGIIVGFDDGGGRINVKLALGGQISIGEALLQPVAKQEYEKFAKVINHEKYENYKNNESKSETNFNKNGRRSRSMSPTTSGRRDNYYNDKKDRRSRSISPTASKRRDDYRSHKNTEKASRRSRSRERKRDTRKSSSDSEADKTYNRKYNHHSRSRRSSSDSSRGRSRTKKKSSKKSSKSSKYDSHDGKFSSDDEKKHKKKYKRSKHHRERS